MIVCGFASGFFNTLTVSELISFASLGLVVIGWICSARAERRRWVRGNKAKCYANVIVALREFWVNFNEICLNVYDGKIPDNEQAFYELNKSMQMLKSRTGEMQIWATTSLHNQYLQVISLAEDVAKVRLSAALGMGAYFSDRVMRSRKDYQKEQEMMIKAMRKDIGNRARGKFVTAGDWWLNRNVIIRDIDSAKNAIPSEIDKDG